jgi:predicted transcriptional regulator YdeE
MEIKNFPGGLYAVTRCKVAGVPETIQTTWKKLVEWHESSRYKRATHQWLEEHLDVENGSEGDFDLDLYLPIAE